MTNAAGFLRAIEASPDDDTVRLVYSDWLEEHGDSDADRARAEFIRIQCKQNAADTDRAREAKLLEAFGPAWAAQYPVHLYELKYHRGFVDPVYLSVWDFLRSAERLAQVTPLHHVKLFKTPSRMTDLAQCSHLTSVRSLDLTSNVIRNAHAAALANSPHLVNLTSLTLAQNHIGVAGCEELATANLPALRTLNLSGNPLRDRGLIALLAARWVAGLTRLSLRNCQLWGPGIEALGCCSALMGLQRLHLGNRGVVSQQAFRALVTAPFTRLEVLDLGGVTDPDDVVLQLASNPALTQLRELHWNAGHLSDTSARALLDSPYLSGLRSIRAMQTGLSPAVRDEFRKRFDPRPNPAELLSDWES